MSQHFDLNRGNDTGVTCPITSYFYVQEDPHLFPAVQQPDEILCQLLDPDGPRPVLVEQQGEVAEVRGAEEDLRLLQHHGDVRVADAAVLIPADVAPGRGGGGGVSV